MTLETYRRRRNFARTPEPLPRRARDRTPRIYVIQKHAARRLHYDLRLEMHGVLVSWALPKQPPVVPGEKRLAMQTEDHPYEYFSFEGRIPEGQYGAGTVEIWDRGTYTHEGGSVEEGKLHFTLLGERLRGPYTLVRFRGREPNAWLLVRRKSAKITEA